MSVFAAHEDKGMPAAGSVRGRLFDGHLTWGRDVAAWIQAQDLVIAPTAEAQAVAGDAGSCDSEASPPTLTDARHRRHPLGSLALGERWHDGPYPVGLPDGGTLWLDRQDPAQGPFVEALLRGARRTQPAARLWRSWPAVMACLVLLVATIAWVDRHGVGLAARAVLPLVPLSVDEMVGKQLLKSLDSGQLAPSTLSADDTVLRRRFAQMARDCGQGRTFALEFRRMRDEPGFNAMALPDGTVLLFDGLREVLTEDEALAVLGHEIGHVVHRHGMGHLLKSLGLLAVASTVLSDFSSALATTVGAVQFLRHSREAEREADAHARECLARAGLDPRVMVGLWRKFQAERERRGGAEPPAWVSTHPGLEERLRAAQQP